jgi:hypothetical protein
MSRKKKKSRTRESEPPMPLYVRGTSGDSMGDDSFYNWPSTKATDQVFEFLKRLFGKRQRPSN